MIRILENLLRIYRIWGWKGIYALLFPVYFQQDIEFKNGGYDIISLRDNKLAYERCKLKFL